MKERPILFSAPMVHAILGGRKTQTRRPVASARHPYGHLLGPEGVAREFLGNTEAVRCPIGETGDRLWVRETWGLMAHTDPTDWHRGSVAGASPDAIVPTYGVEHRANWKVDNTNAFWRPSIHMPRWASRITLEITRVWVEQVQDITEEGAIKEGCVPLDSSSPREMFREIWQSIYGTWDANPWVWAVEFRRVKP